MSLKNERLESTIKKYISDIIQFELKSKNFGIPTVTKVEVSNDNSFATIYISFLGKNKDEAIDIIEKKKGYIRSSLAKKITTRKVPALIFKKDNSFENGSKIDKLLKEIK